MNSEDGQTRLGWANRLMPKDGGVRRILSAHPYGASARQKLDVYAPVSFSDPLPILFFIYGGGWNTGNRREYEFVGRAFAAAGFITVIADYRLVPRVHYPQFVEDSGAALSEAVQTLPAFGGNAERIFVMGHSAGAYNAIMLALDGQRFGAPALGARLRGAIGLSGPYDFYPFDVREAIDAFGRAADPEASQPVNIVRPGAPPVFLGHGSKDVICGPYNSANLAQKLRAAHVPVVERHYPGVDHATPLLALFPALRWRAPIYRDVVAFMRDHA